MTGGFGPPFYVYGPGLGPQARALALFRVLGIKFQHLERDDL